MFLIVDLLSELCCRGVVYVWHFILLAVACRALVRSVTIRDVTAVNVKPTQPHLGGALFGKLQKMGEKWLIQRKFMKFEEVIIISHGCKVSS